MSLPFNASSDASHLYIISAPSGTGKTTLIKQLMKMHPDTLSVSISHTTRSPRSNEVDGQDYHFVSEAEFQRMEEAEEFVESAHIFDCRYGTSKRQLEKQLRNGGDVILEVDWQGAHCIRTLFTDVLESIFILPPNKAALKERLEQRKEDPDILAHRISDADEVISHWSEYRHLIVNDDFDRAVRQLDAIYVAGSLRCATTANRLLVEKLLDK